MILFRVKSWRNLVIGLVISLVIITIPSLARAASLPVVGQLLIKDVMIGSATDATDESVVIINNGPNAIQLQGLELEYKAATGKAWSRRSIVSEARELAPRSTLTFANKINHDISLTSGLAAAGGNLRIISAGIVLDQLAWGTGDSPESKATIAPKAGQLIRRTCDDKGCTDTNNNSADFSLSVGETSASPVKTNASSTPAAVQAANPSDGGKVEVANGDSNLAIEISELLPDPASPLTDTKDEFIELYNSDSTPASLIGWKLSDGKSSHKLDAVTIPAGQYVVLKSAITKLSLNNSGDEVMLIAPDGHTEFTTPNYDKAKSGKSFGATPQGWGWLEQPSPGVVNGSLMANQAESKSTKKSTGTSKNTSKSTSSTKNGKAPQLAKVSNSGPATDNSENGETSTSKGTPWGWVLAGLGVLGLGYGAYEYRPELLAFITKLAAKFGAGH